MSRTALSAPLSLALIACSGSSEPEVAVSELGQDLGSATPTWTAPPGEVVEAPTPVVGAAAQETVAFVDEVVDTGLPLVPPASVEDLVDGEGDPLLEIEVRPGESLVMLSDWSGLSVEAIADANGIRTGSTLYPGQLLEIDVDQETFVAMQDSRDAFEDARLDRYLARRGELVGVTTHTVGTGETAWQIAKDHGALPLWVLASFNRGQDLDRLRIGQEINLPMLGDDQAMDDEPLVAAEPAGDSAAAPAEGPVPASETGNSTIP